MTETGKRTTEGPEAPHGAPGVVVGASGGEGEPSTTWRMQQARILELTGKIYQFADELGISKADLLVTVAKIAHDTVDDLHQIPVRTNGDDR